jgi:nucleoside-diphosphate-sugar epimerase/putative sterol carrier protein
MKVVVTGGSGQLGSLVLERLLSHPEVERIVSLDLVPPSLPDSRIDWRIADMRDPGLDRHLEGADALVHLAFIVMKPSPPHVMYAVNVEGSRRIFEAAARHGLSRIVYTSSVAAYGIVRDLPNPVVESTPRRRTPVLTYSANKFDVEAYLDSFETEEPGVRIVRLRPGILLGRRIAHVNERFLRRRVFPVVGGGRGPIVWDEDVAEAVVLALTREVRGAFNLVADDPLTGEEVARLAGFRPVRVPPSVFATLSKLSALSLFKDSLDAGWLAAAEMDMVASAEKARRELGWKPRYPTSADVAIALGKHGRTRPSRRVEWFLEAMPRVVRAWQSDPTIAALPDNFTVHLDVTGPRGGDFALRISSGAVSVSRGIPRPPTSTLRLSAETLMELLAGKEDVASAHATGTVQVRGAVVGERLLAGLVEGFQDATRKGGVGGTVARGVAKWFDREES